MAVTKVYSNLKDTKCGKCKHFKLNYRRLHLDLVNFNCIVNPEGCASTVYVKNLLGCHCWELNTVSWGANGEVKI